MMPGALAATRAMYRSNNPKYVCLVVEPDTFSSLDENRQTQQTLLPHTMHPSIAIPYYLDLCIQDGMFFDRLFVYRSFMAKSWKDIKDAVMVRLDPEKYYVESGLQKSGYYKGRGYNRNMEEGNGETMLRFTPLKPIQDVAIKEGLSPYAISKLMDYKALCEKHGSHLIVVMAPNMLANALAKEGYVQKNIEIAKFCAEQNIPFFDFYFAREEFIPRLDHYFTDVLHMDYRGANIFSEKFAQVIRDYIDGKDTSHLFYHTTEEFFASIRCITNTWIDEETGAEKDIYIADCLHGESIVPEYSFHLLAPDGTTTMLQPYSTSSVYSCPAGELEGKKLRVYARPMGSDEESIIFYDLACRQQK